MHYIHSGASSVAGHQDTEESDLILDLDKVQRKKWRNIVVMLGEKCVRVLHEHLGGSRKLYLE